MISIDSISDLATEQNVRRSQAKLAATVVKEIIVRDTVRALSWHDLKLISYFLSPVPHPGCPPRIAPWHRGQRIPDQSHINLSELSNSPWAWEPRCNQSGYLKKNDQCSEGKIKTSFTEFKRSRNPSHFPSTL